MANWNAFSWTAEQDALITRAYQSGQRGANKALARKFNMTQRAISARAAKLGLSPLVRIMKAGGEKWKPAEIAIVEAHLAEPIAKIRARLYAKGYSRAIGGISSLIHRQRQKGLWLSRIEDIEDHDGLTATAIIAGLGVNEWTFHRWIKNGWLRARSGGGNHRFVIHRADLRTFLKHYAAHWDHRNADHWFLVDALTYSQPPAKAAQREAACPIKPTPLKP